MCHSNSVSLQQVLYSQYHCGVFYFPSFQTNIKEIVKTQSFLYNKNLVIADSDAQESISIAKHYKLCRVTPWNEVDTDMKRKKALTPSNQIRSTC